MSACTHVHMHAHTFRMCVCVRGQAFKHTCVSHSFDFCITIIYLLQTPNSIIEYEMVTERDSPSAKFFDVNRQTGEVMVIQPLFNDPKLRAKYEVGLSARETANAGQWI